MCVSFDKLNEYCENRNEHYECNGSKLSMCI